MPNDFLYSVKSVEGISFTGLPTTKALEKMDELVAAGSKGVTLKRDYSEKIPN